MSSLQKEFEENVAKKSSVPNPKFLPLTQNDGDTIFLLFSELKAERINSCLGKAVRQILLEDIKYA